MTLILGLAAMVAFALVATAPFTWILMLFLGNLGQHVGYIDCIPGGFLIAVLTGRGSNAKEK